MSTTTVERKYVGAPPLQESDRCDRCRAKAYVSVLIVAVQLPLRFCAHHFAKHQDVLTQIAFIRDERGRLLR